MALGDQPVQFRKTFSGLIAFGGRPIGAGTGGPVEAADHESDSLLADVEVVGDVLESDLGVLEKEGAQPLTELGRREVGSIRKGENGTHYVIMTRMIYVVKREDRENGTWNLFEFEQRGMSH